MYKEFCVVWTGAFCTCERTDRRTDRHRSTDTLIAILCTPPRAVVDIDRDRRWSSTSSVFLFTVSDRSTLVPGTVCLITSHRHSLYQSSQHIWWRPATSGVAKSSTCFGWFKGGIHSSAGWQVHVWSHTACEFTVAVTDKLMLTAIHCLLYFSLVTFRYPSDDCKVPAQWLLWFWTLVVR